jgi:hypothetical protein
MKKAIVPLMCALLLLVMAGCSSSNEYAVPDDIATLVEDFGEAVNRGDGSVLEFYQPSGYHVYGDERIAYDDIVSHMDTGWTGEMITEPLLVVNQEDHRYVVVCGIRSSSPGDFRSAESAMSFEIVRTADDGLELVHTAWLYSHES